MKTFRKIIFWTHLIIGLTAGLVIAISAFTGATMAFEKQTIAWCERKESRVTPPSKDAERWSLQDITANIRDEYPDARPQSIVVSSDPTAIISVSLSRTNTLYVNPYTGEFQPQGAQQARAFFQLMLRWHRWLGISAPPSGSQPNQTPVAPAAEGMSSSEPPRPAGGLREFASTVVGVSCGIFLALSISGLYLWWPRQWTAQALRAITLMSFKLRGKPRDWNWHNAIGFWSSPVLILTTFTGLVMSFHVLGDWIYKRPENENAALKISTPEPGTRPLGSDALLAVAQTEILNWETITLRLANRRQRGGGGMQRPSGENREATNLINTNTATATNSLAPGETLGQRREGGARAPQPVSISVTEIDSWSPVPVQLQLNPYTGDVLRVERLSDFGFGRAFRAMNRSLHTGEAGGVVHQALSLLACLGALVLVWTGFALSWRRFFGRAKSVKTAENSLTSP